MRIEDFIDAIERALAGPLPGPAAQFALAPSVRREIHEISVEGKACREGSVLILLYPRAGELNLVLTVRDDGLPVHAGQVSLPGGRREAGESLVETALREAREELGIAPDSVRLLGALTPIYIPPSNFCVYPQVAAAAERPSFVPEPGEVSAVAEVPLRLLAQPENQGRELREIDGQPMEIPFFWVNGYQVWGATAMILAELLAIVTMLPGWS